MPRRPRKQATEPPEPAPQAAAVNLEQAMVELADQVASAAAAAADLATLVRVATGAAAGSKQP